MAEGSSGRGGIRASVKRHRLIVFGGLVIALTIASMAAELAKRRHRSRSSSSHLCLR